MMTYILIEFQPAWDGGTWNILGFFDTVEMAKAVLLTRPAGRAHVLLKTEKVEL